MADHMAAPAVDGGAALLDAELSRYRKSLEEDLEGAQRRYGFTLFHSLSPVEKVIHLKRLGCEARDGIDHYNLGTALALQENFAEAIVHLEKALAENPNWPEALHNLALALERAGKRDKARAEWERLLKLDLPPEDREAVEAHLKTLK